MWVGFSNLLVGALALMLVAAAATDIRSRTIPNWLNAAVALGAIPFWWASGLALWPDVAVQVGLAGLLFAIFAAAFAAGFMGGGDVKMIAALALWLPPGATVVMLVLMSIGGGLLTVAMVVRHRLAARRDAVEVPYGVAIAGAGLWLIGERFLNHFA